MDFDAHPHREGSHEARQEGEPYVDAARQRAALEQRQRHDQQGEARRRADCANVQMLLPNDAADEPPDPGGRALWLPGSAEGLQGPASTSRGRPRARARVPAGWEARRPAGLAAAQGMGEPSATEPTTEEKRMRRLTGGHEGVFFAKWIEGWGAVVKLTHLCC